MAVRRSDRGGERAAMMYSLIVTCKLNDVDPQAWLTDVLARIASTLPQARRAAAVAMEGYEHVQRVRSRGLKTADLSYQGGRPNIRPKDKLKRPLQDSQTHRMCEPSTSSSRTDGWCSPDEYGSAAMRDASLTGGAAAGVGDFLPERAGL